MKKLKLFVMAAAASLACNVQAQKAQESFNYEVGADLLTETGADEENGWTSGWVPSSMITNVTNESISYNDQTFGNALSVTGNEWGSVARDINNNDWPDGEGNVYWLSFFQELRNDEYPEKQYSGLCLVGKTNSKNLYIGLPWVEGGNTDQLCISVNDNGNQEKHDLTTIQFRTALWIVAKIEMSGDESGEQLSVWVNPDPSQEPNVDDANATSSAQDFNGGLKTLFINCHNEIEVVYDEIRLGTSWEDVNTLGTSVKKTSANELNFQCTPNLVNTSATVKYDLATDALVKVSLYNTLGSEVAVLVDGYQTAGMQNATLSADGLSDGVYLCKIQAGSQTAVTQVIVKK